MPEKRREGWLSPGLLADERAEVQGGARLALVHAVP